MEQMIARTIKSKYILKQIFDILQEFKMLNIIRYNKNLQKLLNITIEDYKKNGIIEIEIIPCDNTNGKFISFNEKLSSYYHIYFNDNKRETKNTIINTYNAKKIKVVIDHQVESLKGLFKECHDITNIEYISDKLFVAKFDKSNFFKDLQFSNISDILVTLFVLKFDKFNSFNASQSLNI